MTTQQYHITTTKQYDNTMQQNNMTIVVPGNISGIVLLVLGGKGTPSMFDPAL